MDSCLYVTSNLGAAATVTEAGLAETTERHHLAIRLGPMATCLDPLGELARRPDLLGVIVAMERGWPGSSHLRFASAALKQKRRVWFYWPSEQAVEVIDADTLGTYWRLWAYCTADLLKRRLKGLVRPQVHDAGADVVERCSVALRQLYGGASPVPFPTDLPRPTGDRRIPGTGVYLRTDYWVQLTSGGSYGHTCYVARELAAVTEDFTCLMASPFAMLDEFGLRQVVMPPASDSAAEIPLLAATWHYYPILKVAFGMQRPAYIYERLCLGNFAAALVSQELGIPYILEYNGSEISMSRSFNGTSLEHEQMFVRAEDAAFRQATLITVVSQVLKDSLVARKVDPRKILVNPNGADPVQYAPPSAEARRAVRTNLGYTDDDRVIGFSGTFGGWHGIDVLAEAIPKICARAPKAKFLLIGDGSHKPMLDEAVSQHHLQSRVHSAGRVPQQEGARLLGACDIFVSPHNSHMVDSKFFGSPTKLFEYMAMGGGIVGSDLEQLGEVLSPALRPADLGPCRPARRRPSARCCARPAASKNSSRQSSASLIGRTCPPRSAATPGRPCSTSSPGHATSTTCGASCARNSRPARRSRRSPGASPPATPTRSRSRTSGTTTRSGRTTRRPPSRTRSSGSRRSRRTATASTPRGCPR